MPSVSKAQRGAMAAAAAGQSTLGIPPSVGRDFMDADTGASLPARRAGKPKSEPRPTKSPAISPGGSHGVRALFSKKGK